MCFSWSFCYCLRSHPCVEDFRRRKTGLLCLEDFNFCMFFETDFVFTYTTTTKCLHDLLKCDLKKNFKWIYSSFVTCCCQLKLQGFSWLEISTKSKLMKVSLANPSLVALPGSLKNVWYCWFSPFCLWPFSLPLSLCETPTFHSFEKKLKTPSFF